MLDGRPRRPKSGMSSRWSGSWGLDDLSPGRWRDERHLGSSGLGGDDRRFLLSEPVACSPQVPGSQAMVRSQPVGAAGNGARRHGSTSGSAQVSVVGTRIAANECGSLDGWRPAIWSPPLQLRVLADKVMPRCESRRRRRHFLAPAPQDGEVDNRPRRAADDRRTGPRTVQLGVGTELQKGRHRRQKPGRWEARGRRLPHTGRTETRTCRWRRLGPAGRPPTQPRHSSRRGS
jgi:hypothetical protein